LSSSTHPHFLSVLSINHATPADASGAKNGPTIGMEDVIASAT